MSCVSQRDVESWENNWQVGDTPVAVVMITLNEGHNLEAVLQNLKGWAQEVFIVDSYSSDGTIDTALEHGVYVVQRKFRGFGDQWNFALRELPIHAPWTMKLDPDERLSEQLKENIRQAIASGKMDGGSFYRRLWFMGKPLPIKQKIIRFWKTGKCSFTDIAVNEQPIVDGFVVHVCGDLEHHDSPNLEHWLNKQNHYSTAEAVIAYNGSKLADIPSLIGSPLQRHMWMKKHFYKLPFRYVLLFLYYWLLKGTWRVGWVGFAWARLRADVMRLVEYKKREMELTGAIPIKRNFGPGEPDPRVNSYD